jgi:hypothetical protein
MDTDMQVSNKKDAEGLVQKTKDETVTPTENKIEENKSDAKKEFDPYKIEDGFHHVRMSDMYEKDGKIFFTVDVVQRVRTETSDEIVNESGALRELQVSEGAPLELTHCDWGTKTFGPREFKEYFDRIDEEVRRTFVAPSECDYVAFLYPGLYSRVMTITVKNNIILNLQPAYYPG